MEWDQYSKEELEYQYSPSRWSVRGSAEEVIRTHIDLVSKISQTNKEHLSCQLNTAYGETQGQKLDVFGLDTCPNDAPIFVYIHGGYWQDLSRPISAYCVEPLYKAGIVTVIPGYDLAPKVKVPEIVEEIREAVLWVLRLASKRGSKGVVIGGHSAGAHLAAMVVHSELLDKHISVAPLLKGLVYISGVFDLRPLVGTYVNDALKLSKEDAAEISPLQLMNQSTAGRYSFSQIVVVGEHESPEFKKQSERYYEEMKKVANGNVEFLVLKDMDHFNIVENLSRDDYELTVRILALLTNL